MYWVKKGNLYVLSDHNFEIENPSLFRQKQRQPVRVSKLPMVALMFILNKV